MTVISLDLLACRSSWKYSSAIASVVGVEDNANGNRDVSVLNLPNTSDQEIVVDTGSYSTTM
jgi:hypothetical protein